MVRYLPVEEKLYSPDIGWYCTFGIRALELTESSWNERAFISDVAVDRDFVSSLAEQCTHAQLDPVHLEAVVLNMI